MSEKELKNKMDTFIECYKNGMIFGAPTDIEFYEKITTLQQKVKQLESIRKEAIEYITSEEYFDLNNCKTGSFVEDSNNYLKAHHILLNILNKGSEE